MVHVYGVTHSFEITSIMGTKNCVLTPSNGFLSALERLPGKRRIGLESLSHGDWREIDIDLAALGEDACRELRPRFNHSSDLYWDVLRRKCEDLGHEVFFVSENTKVPSSVNL